MPFGTMPASCRYKSFTCYLRWHAGLFIGDIPQKGIPVSSGVSPFLKLGVKQMMRSKGIFKAILILIICTSLVTGTGVTVDAAYSIGFGTKDIEITSPDKNGLPFDGSLTIEGKTSLPEVWLCVRGPGGEVETYPADVSEDEFEVRVNLRFGKGAYTVWAGDNPRKFDGKIRFEVKNTGAEDTRYLAPSAYVDSNHEDVKALAVGLTAAGMTDMEKIRAIHKWATSNIEYDYEAYLEGDNTMRAASETIKRGKGTCRDYSFVVAALARALDIPARVVYGSTAGTSGWGAQLHAWNELYADGRWVTVDTTWDAGYIKEGRFVASPTDKYFDPDTEEFAKTHRSESVMVY